MRIYNLQLAINHPIQICHQVISFKLTSSKVHTYNYNKPNFNTLIAEILKKFPCFRAAMPPNMPHVTATKYPGHTTDSKFFRELL